jgi:ribonuclease D
MTVRTVGMAFLRAGRLQRLEFIPSYTHSIRICCCSSRGLPGIAVADAGARRGDPGQAAGLAQTANLRIDSGFDLMIARVPGHQLPVPYQDTPPTRPHWPGDQPGVILWRMTPVPAIIDATPALLELVKRCRDYESIALDTEFVWERTYYPRLGLIQLALDKDTCFLLDAVALEDLTPLGELLASPDLIKILHDAPQDLTIIRRVTGAFPCAVFDTRCAAGFADLRSTISLAELVATVAGVDLPKTESRTDWIRRPLTAEQISYAAEDVCYLHAVREKLVQRVEQRGRTQWLAEELAHLDDPGLYKEREPQEQFRRVKGSGRASRRELAILRVLAAWREEEARRCDRPRGRVIPDSTLLFLARRRPQSQEALTAVGGLGKRYADTVLELVARGLETPEADWPQRRGGRRPADEERVESEVARAMSILRSRGESEVIDPPFVAARAEVKALIIAGPEADPLEHRLLRGWRRLLVGDQLLEMMQQSRRSP